MISSYWTESTSGLKQYKIGRNRATYPIEIEEVIRRYLRTSVSPSLSSDVMNEDAYQLTAPRREVLRCKSSREVTHPMNETK